MVHLLYWYDDNSGYKHEAMEVEKFKTISSQIDTTKVLIFPDDESWNKAKSRFGF